MQKSVSHSPFVLQRNAFAVDIGGSISA